MSSTREQLEAIERISTMEAEKEVSELFDNPKCKQAKQLFWTIKKQKLKENENIFKFSDLATHAERDDV